jgi:hypothetical protein
VPHTTPHAFSSLSSFNWKTSGNCVETFVAENVSLPH